MERTHVSKEEEGCMGGLMHFFDFNHSLVARKMIASKQTGELKAPKNRSNLDKMAKSKASRCESVQLCGYESPNASTASRKLIGMPIRALIAQDLSKGSHIKSCTSSVIARLMGLETIPSTRSKVLHKTSPQNVIHNIDEKPSHKVFIKKQCQQQKLPDNAQLYMKKGKPSITSDHYKGSNSTIKQNSTKEDERNDRRSTYFRNHPQELQLEEFKKEFEAHQSQKIGHLKNRHDNSASHLTDKRAILGEKMHKVNRNERQDSLKIYSPLDELREFWDDTELLQFNKEKFSDKIKSTSTLTSKSKSFCSEQPFGMEGRHAYADSSMGYATSCQIPARIVVLKPSTQKVRNLNFPSSTYTRALKDHVTGSTHVLQRLRENLRKNKGHRHERGSKCLCTGEHFRDDAKDSREIAREIARQVRENVTRMNIKNSYRNSNKRISNCANEIEDDASSSDDEDFIPTHRHYRRNHCHYQGKKLIMEVGNEKKVDVYHHSRKKVASSVDEAQHLLVDNIATRKGVWCEESDYQSSPSIGTSPSSKGSQRHSMEGIRLGENYRRALFHSYAHNNEEECVQTYRDCEMENFNNYEKCGVKNKVKSHRVSLPHSIEQNQAGVHVIDDRFRLREIPKMDDKNVAPTRVHNAVTLIDEIRSINMSMTSHLYTLTSDMKANSEGMEVDQVISSSEDSMVHEHNESMLVTHEKKQFQTSGNSVSIDNDEDGLSYSSDLVTAGTDEKIQHRGNDTMHEVAKENKVDYGSKDIDNIKALEGSNNKQCKILVEYEALPSSVDNLSSIQRETGCEQPSPVSVLDLCYEEEGSVSMELKQINSDIQDLQALVGLQFDDGHGKERGTKEQSKEQTSSQNNDNDNGVNRGFFNDFLDEISFPSGREPEMLYVREILLVSGFMRTDTSFLLPWYNPHQPLDPSLFETIESNYMGKGTELQRKDKTMDAVLGLSQRRLLFDIVNQSLFDIIWPHLNCDIHLSYSQQAMPSIDIFKQVCLFVNRLLCSHAEGQDTLENLVTEDLVNKSQWFDMSIQSQALMLEIENGIIDNLIEEILLVL